MAVQRAEACNLIVPRIGFRRTRTQRSGTQSAAADGTRTRRLFELRRCRSLIEAVLVNRLEYENQRKQNSAPKSPPVLVFKVVRLWLDSKASWQ